MDIGVIYPQNELKGDPDAVRRIGLAVEELGYSHLSAYDHVVGASHEDRDPPLWGPYTQDDPFHDPFMMFAHLAALTRKINFYTRIMVVPQRQTALVARQAADLALMSGNRFALGIGVGWNHVEFEALDIPFATRGQRLEEQIEVLRRLWTEPLIDYKGRFHRMDRVALNPRPDRPIAIWLGGFADVALRRAAAIGDGFVFAHGAADAFEQKHKLMQLLREQQRDAGKFAFHCSMAEPRSPAEIADLAGRWQEAGGTHFSFLTMYHGFETIEQHIDYLKEVTDTLKCAGL